MSRGISAILAGEEQQKPSLVAGGRTEWDKHFGTWVGCFSQN